MSYIRLTQIDAVNIPNPPAGRASFFLGADNSLKAKLPNGDIVLISITEEAVQDIIGSLLSDSSTVDVTYDDAGNALTLEVIEENLDSSLIPVTPSGGISATNLDGAVAQAGAHINNTSNPHGVTKAQVGLGNADNTSDLNKPISTATQSALNLKADLSAVFTQAALLGGALDGRYFTEAEIVALLPLLVPVGRLVNTQGGIEGGGDLSADRTLQLTDTGVTPGTYNIGQITVDAKGRISSVTQNFFGSQAEDFDDTTPFSTSSGANQVAASFTTASKPIGRYRVAIKWNFTMNSTTSSAFFGLYVDGALVGSEMQVELKDVTDDCTWNQWGYLDFASASTHTIQLRTRTENGSTVTVSRVMSEIWRVS